jgi:Na+-translocating ferredoxin:NAD+ oxidoreductase subunit A
MSALLLILLSTVLVNVVALTSVPAWRPFAGIAELFAASRALAISGAFALPAITVASWLLARMLLQPLGLDYLRTPAFAAIILTVVSGVEAALRRYSTLAPQRPAFTLLLSTNSALFGVALLAQSRTHTFFGALLFAIGAAGAQGFLLLAFAALYDRLRHADVPAVFREAPLALVSAGIIALACMGFTGVIQE